MKILLVDDEAELVSALAERLAMSTQSNGSRPQASTASRPFSASVTTQPSFSSSRRPPMFEATA